MERITMLAAAIDHTLLAATATEEDIRHLCAEAREWGFAAVCVNPLHVALAAGAVRGSAVRVCTVVGFPLGATTTAVKIAESLGALEDGARELDVVATLGLLRGRAYGRYRDDLAAVIEVARRTSDVTVKVIIETGLLTREEKLIAARAVAEVGADFLKTSTGMLGGGATVEDLRLLRGALPLNVRLKASGGIRTLAQARALVAAGADRLGTSAGVAIARDERRSLDGEPPQAIERDDA
jgi:deoxyribose-phosphate aldolase